MTVQVRSQVYAELPEYLLVCPICHLATLRWDGCGAWRCTYVRPARHVGNLPDACHYGLSLAAIFDDGDLELRLCTSRVSWSEVRLTRFGCELAAHGLIVLPWLSRADALAQLQTMDTSEEQEDRWAVYARLMQEPTNPAWQALAHWRNLRALDNPDADGALP